MSAISPAPKPRPRRRRWLLVPLGLLLLLAVVTLWAYIRGTSVDTTAITPGRGDRPVSQLYRTPDGHVTVRAAVLLDVPREKVWAIVTDFDHYSEFLPYLQEVRVEDGIVKGKAKSALRGYWDFALTPREERQSEPWRAIWDEHGTGEVRLNHGGWTLAAPSAGQTLLVLELEAEVKGYPNWVLRNFFLYRLRQVLEAVQNRSKDE